MRTYWQMSWFILVSSDMWICWINLKILFVNVIMEFKMHSVQWSMECHVTCVCVCWICLSQFFCCCCSCCCALWLKSNWHNNISKLYYWCWMPLLASYTKSFRFHPVRVRGMAILRKIPINAAAPWIGLHPIIRAIGWKYSIFHDSEILESIEYILERTE